MTTYIKKLIRRPELIFRPAQLLKRIIWIFCKSSEKKMITLPWGMEMTVDPSDRIGASILKTGTYDTALLECLWRLTRSGETCMDIGANYGVMTSLLAKASGPNGRIIAFEAHPEIFLALKKNASKWQDQHSIAKIQSENFGISDKQGEAELIITNQFDSNNGSASISNQTDERHIKKRITVSTTTLNDYFTSSEQSIGVCKIDIEGHEKFALSGANELLKKKKIRDIIYEDHNGYPSPVSKLLEDHGYKIFLIRKGLFRPLLLRPDTVRYELPNFLATLNPERAIKKLKGFGYKTL